MVMKRASVSPVKKPVRRKAKAPSERSDGVAMVVPDPGFRRELIAAEAYFLAERRGFAAGHELADWSAAEAVVDLRLQELEVA